jgi:hypothetical protein
MGEAATDDRPRNSLATSAAIVLGFAALTGLATLAFDAPAERASPPQAVSESDKAPATAVTDGLDSSLCSAPNDDDVEDTTSNSCFGSLARISGRVVDARGEPIEGAGLRFWSAGSRKTEWDTAADGSFDIVADAEGVTYDVDVIVWAHDSLDRVVRRIHAGRVRAGDRDVALKLNAAPNVLAEGVLVDDAARPLAGWTVEGDAPEEFECETDVAGRFRVTSWRSSKPGVVLRLLGPTGSPRAILRETRDATTGSLRLTAAPPGIAGIVVVGDGRSPAGAVVRLRDAAGAGRSVSVGATGTFAFDRLDASSSYELAAELPGYETLPSGGWLGDSHAAQLHLVAPCQRFDGKAFGADGKALAGRWIRFVEPGGVGEVQTMTEADGSFSTIEARDKAYDAYLLVPGSDGRLVPGPKLGRVRGGDRNLELRVPR